jgi:hypothetical protein
METPSDILSWCSSADEDIIKKIDSLLDVYKNNKDFNDLLISYTRIQSEIKKVEDRALDLF